MRIREIVDSINKGLAAKVIGFLDYEVIIQDRLTGDFLPIDEIAIDQARVQLHIVINSEVSEQRAAAARERQMTPYGDPLYDLVTTYPDDDDEPAGMESHARHLEGN